MNPGAPKIAPSVSAASAHTYATFAYDNLTIRTNFLGLDLVGAVNGTTIPVLSRVTMADGKVYAFEYNTYASGVMRRTRRIPAIARRRNGVLNGLSHQPPMNTELPGDAGYRADAKLISRLICSKISTLSLLVIKAPP